MGRRLVVAACALATALGACSGSGARPDDDPFQAIPHATAFNDPRTSAAPRWERVRAFRGTGDDTLRFDIGNGAIQWRIMWSCRAGSLAAEVAPSSDDEAFIDASCPDRGQALAVDTGAIAVEVQADGRWSMLVEQQVDTPVHEKPLAAMKAPGAEVLAEGGFYEIEREGEGTASLYRLPNGRLALRFENFETSPNVGLFVWTSRAARPRTTKQAFRSQHRQIAELTSTAGEQNYVLPRAVTPRDVRSVVIWCEPIRIAYVAAALSRS